MIQRFIKTLSITGLIALTGCNAAYKYWAEPDIQYNSAFDPPLIVDAVSPLDGKNLALVVQVTNISGNDAYNGLAKDVKAALAANDISVVTDPKKADYVLQIQVTQAGATRATGSGPNAGDSLVGGVAGGVAGAQIGSGAGSVAAGAGGAVAGLLLASYLDAQVVDKTATVVANIQVTSFTHQQAEYVSDFTENKSLGGKGNKDTTNITIANGGVIPNSRTQSGKIRQIQKSTFTIRANQAGMDSDEAVATMRKKMASALSGIFGDQ